jgi:hypothetical protein
MVTLRALLGRECTVQANDDLITWLLTIEQAEAQRWQLWV